MNDECERFKLLWIFLLKLLFIYLFRNKNCHNHFTKTAFENQQFKNLKTDYFKNRQVSFFGNFENQGSY